MQKFNEQEAKVKWH